MSFPLCLTFLDRASQLLEACPATTWELVFCRSTALADLVWGWLRAGGHGGEGAHRGGLLPPGLVPVAVEQPGSQGVLAPSC